MNRFIYFPLVIFSLLSANSFPQDLKCSKPKVNVILSETFHPENRIEVYNHFQGYYTSVTDSTNITPGFEYWQTEEDFYTRIQEYIFQTLQEYNPDVEFVSKSTESGEYKFDYFLNLYAIDVVDPETGIPYSKIGYNIGAKLIGLDVCGTEAWVIKHKRSQDLDLFQAIKNLVGFYFMNINREIIDHERRFLVPPRGPRIETQYSRKSVSPLSEERKADVQLNVYNCKDQIVYMTNNGQKVFCPKKTERGENCPTPMFLQVMINTENIVTLIITRPTGGSLRYELKKGIQPGIEKFEILTCGRDKKEKKTIELNIDGLEIQVSPKKPAIKPDEQTAVDIYFNRVSPDGKKQPVAGKEVSLSIKGLADGSVTPSKSVTTDSNGKGTLQYKAGDRDEKITITASYQPVNYLDKVTGSGSVSVIPGNFAWTGSIDLEITQTFNCDVEEPTSDLGTKRILADDHKTTYANITIGLSDFNLPANGTSAGAKLQFISGEVTVIMNEDHTIDGSAEKTQCHNDGTGRWEWVSPGNWNTWNETMAGQAYADIKDGVINLLITKEMLGDKEAMNNMQQKMAEMQAKLQDAYNSMDKQAMEKMKGEMRNKLQGDPKDAMFPVKAVIDISFGVRNYPVYTSRERKAFNVCTGEFEENESSSETVEMPLMPPIGAEMKGEYTRGRNGNDRIELSINETRHFNPTFGSGTSCPEGKITINGSITLERNKK
ncbi:MAG: hypothetical protein GX622_09340 [Bacteroidales bacterium]|nr:hypothetical protein [Bacteroidales bacterium]